MSDRATTRELLDRLRRHYIKPGAPLPGGVFLEEVGFNGTANLSRCDAIYVGFTGTSGRNLVGHEVKASRADWQKELDSPGKADAWADQCHAWYVVAAPDIVRPGELPDGWGLMVPGKSKTRMQVVTPARVHSDRTPSWNVTRSLLSRYDTLRAETIAHAQQKAQADARQQVAEQVQATLANRDPGQRAETEAREMLTQIAQALGFDDVRAGSYSWGNGIAMGELTPALGRYVRADRDLAKAAANLHHRYNGAHIDVLRQTLDAIDTALADARVALVDPNAAAAA